MKSHLLIGFIVLGIVSHSFGGGSIGWTDDAVPLLKQHPDLLEMIQKSLEVQATGTGVRLGKDFGDEQGKRIPPFEFPARLKGSTGPYNLLLIIHDPSGITDGGDKGTWLEIRANKSS